MNKKFIRKGSFLLGSVVGDLMCGFPRLSVDKIYSSALIFTI